MNWPIALKTKLITKKIKSFKNKKKNAHFSQRQIRIINKLKAK